MKTITIQLDEHEARFLRNAADAFTKATAVYANGEGSSGKLPDLGAVRVWNKIRDMIDNASRS